MDCELNGLKIKYEDRKIWLWRELKSKPSYWFELKGCLKKGYRCVRINYKSFQYHRVVYFIHNPDWDIHDSCRDNSIDHIDRNPLNNNIENLRAVSHSQNQWNTDAKGYTFNKARGKYQAQISVDGKYKNLGYFKTEQEAIAAYLQAKAIHHQLP
tara:strand:+ start:96 stop:560 length:465 start_codon:yes stop_codon:yes gene_type:complete